MGERQGFVLPLLYVLLASKSEAVYTKMWKMIRTLWPKFNPTTANLDYEVALMNSLKTAFPGIQLGGCLFHLVKNMKKHLATNNLLKKYRERGSFSEGAGMIVAMAFLRPDDIEIALTELDDHFEATEGLAPFKPILDWFEVNYVGQLTRNGRRTPPYQNSMWTVYQRTLDGEARTNNHAEAAHRRLQTELAFDHPTLWRLIDGLKKCQRSRDLEYVNSIAGEEPPHERNKYVQADRKLVRILENYDQSTLLEKLKGISYVYGMV